MVGVASVSVFHIDTYTPFLEVSMLLFIFLKFRLFVLLMSMILLESMFIGSDRVNPLKILNCSLVHFLFVW